MKKIQFLLVLLVVSTVLIALPKMGKATSQDETPVQSLPTVGTVEQLRSILAEAGSSRTLMEQGMVVGAKSAQLSPTQSSPASAAAASPSLDLGRSSDYSTTNLQVGGVDEADIIKNDGNFIYQVNGQELIVTQAYPSNAMSVVSRIGFKQGEFTPQELYVDDQYLVLIGSAYYQGESQPGAPVTQPSQDSQKRLYPPIFNRSTSKVIIYDLADKANLTKLREVELDGLYVSSRKVGSNLYLIANKYLDTYRIMEQGLEPPLPAYRDTVGKGEFITIGYNDIHYFPNFVEPNYLLIASLDLDQRDKEMQVSTYLGSGQNIYASTANLYIAVSQYQQVDQPTQATSNPQLTPTQSAPDTASSSMAPSQLKPNSLKMTTALYKFGLTQGKTTFKAKGEVPGSILNQFAMDENNDYFRIATTTGELWRTDELTSKNNVYILDQNLQVTGKVEDIAPGEKIYSVRFMGDRGYMVTFKNVDPFFVLDLKNPAAPTILGALKIPGFSDYLQPYDENHIIGFGKETVEVSQNNGQGILPGAPNGSTAFYQGLKLAVFDVTDVSQPVEMFKTIIGDRGTDSEVLHNHKALLFDKDKGILSFPVTLMEVNNPVETNSKNGVPEYGQFTFQGAYVYQFDLLKGFTLRGRITHLKDADLLKAGQYYVNDSNAIERIIFIKDMLYTISKGTIKANDLASLQEKNSLILNH
ncbi:MAG TPA: beta-propeller domain-containing protein [Desulfosporosinus sp.]|nr:beta-propeller domain-containing protein [Desulfosporosinus sp.]